MDNTLESLNACTNTLIKLQAEHTTYVKDHDHWMRDISLIQTTLLMLIVTELAVTRFKRGDE